LKTSNRTPKQHQEQATISLEECHSKLNELIGLESVKERVSGLVSLAAMQKTRRQSGLKVVPITMHMVFTGAPGTGKTTVARLMGQFYRALGRRKKGHFVEVSSAELVGQYVGETRQKTNDKIAESLDGVLFIDEAYSITGSGEAGKKDSFGMECVNALVGALENYRDRLVVIAAGYKQDMEEFLRSNAGLASRFPNKIHFDNYAPAELMQVFRSIAAAESMQLTSGAVAQAECALTELHRKSSGRKDWANARSVRILFEQAKTRLAVRLFPGGTISPGLSVQDATRMEASDIPDDV